MVTSDPASGAAVLSVLENIARPLYSNPPAHGARIAALVLSSAELASVSIPCWMIAAWLPRSNLCTPSFLSFRLQEWRAELASAMARVQVRVCREGSGGLRRGICVGHLHSYGALQRMRVLLRAALVARGTPGSWDHITQQIGMFSYTGLTEAQSTRMVRGGS